MPLSSNPSAGSRDTMSSMFFAMTKVSFGVAACAGATAESTTSAAPASRLRLSLFMRPPLQGRHRTGAGVIAITNDWERRKRRCARPADSKTSPRDAAPRQQLGCSCGHHSGDRSDCNSPRSPAPTLCSHALGLGIIKRAQGCFCGYAVAGDFDLELSLRHVSVGHDLSAVLDIAEADRAAQRVA